MGLTSTVSVWWWWIAVTTWCVRQGGAVQLVIDPSGEWKVPENALHNLTMSLKLSKIEKQMASEAPAEAMVEVTALHRDVWRIDWQHNVGRFSAQEAAAGVNKTLTFSGYYWGRTHVGLFLTHDDLHLLAETPTRSPNTTSHILQEWQSPPNATLLNEIQIVVDRADHVYEKVFIGLGSIFLLFNNINMGAQLDIDIIKKVLQRPLGPLCGFISQFACMPLVTFGIGYFFFTDPLYRLGLFILGCSPGGLMSNFWTLIFGGDINLSITMTAISTLGAMGMMPFWIFTLGQRLTRGTPMQVPYVNLVISLISLTVPMGIGLAFRAWRPVWADRGAKIIKPFTFMLIIFFLSFWFYSSSKVFAMMTWQMAVAGFLVASIGFGFGATLARLFCLPRKQIIAICIETAFQNGGVVFILLKLSLPSPDSDLAALPAMATMMQIGPPMIIYYLILITLRRYCGYCQYEAEEDAKEKGAEKNLNTGTTTVNEVDVFLFKSDKNIITDSITKENENRYGLVLQGMTRLKLAADLKETNIV